MGAVRRALHIGMSGSPGNHPGIAEDAGRPIAVSASAARARVDIPAGPHAYGGREQFGAGKVRRHDLLGRSLPLSRTWLITFWTLAMFRTCVVTLSSYGRLLAMPIRYTIPFTVSTV